MGVGPCRSGSGVVFSGPVDSAQYVGVPSPHRVRCSAGGTAPRFWGRRCGSLHRVVPDGSGLGMQQVSGWGARERESERELVLRVVLAQCGLSEMGVTEQC